MATKVTACKQLVNRGEVEFNHELDLHISRGWQPLGPATMGLPSGGSIYFGITLVKYEEETSP
jgi:hypothetical protein